MELRKFQKNEIAEIIKEHGVFQIKDFTWEGTTFGFDDYFSVLKYKDSNWNFQFVIYGNSGDVNYSPGEIRWEDYKKDLNWDAIKSEFKDWLDYLKKELEEPDLWEEYVNQELGTDTRTITDLSNEKFTEPEIMKITEGIDNIKAYIEEKGFADDEEKKVYVEDQSNWLKEALGRLGRRDWFLTSISVINLIINALKIDIENAKTVFIMLKHALAGIIKSLPI